MKKFVCFLLLASLLAFVGCEKKYYFTVMEDDDAVQYYSYENVRAIGSGIVGFYNDDVGVLYGVEYITTAEGLDRDTIICIHYQPKDEDGNKTGKTPTHYKYDSEKGVFVFMPPPNHLLDPE